VYQLTCSPLHNYVPLPMSLAFRLAWSRAAERTVRTLLDLLATVPPLHLGWRRLAGPWFGNQIATLHLHGRSARLVVEQTRRSPQVEATLHQVADLTLT
jgi:hypothetical protein